MLTRITSFTRNGLKDWFLQRVSAIVLALYPIFIVAYIVGHHPITYPLWVALFHHIAMKIFTILALLALIAHVWVGMWTILTDYITAKALRGLLQVLIVFALVACLVVMIQILWG